jgi:hypothetical protein
MPGEVAIHKLRKAGRKEGISRKETNEGVRINARGGLEQKGHKGICYQKKAMRDSIQSGSNSM